MAHPIALIREAHRELHISVPTLHASAKHLIGLGVLRQLPTSGRQRLFAYERYLEI